MRLRVRGCVAWAAMAGAAMAPLQALRADTLREALIRTYAGNPTMTGERARLRALDEGVAIARSNGRPNIIGSASVDQTFDNLSRFRNGGRTLTGEVDLSYPLFQGGRVRNAIGAADDRVAAGRADLRTTEGEVFTSAVAAYMDVIRDTAIVDLNANQVKVLGTNLQASRDRFEVGDLTRTDVAQSEARLEGARSQFVTAQGQLAISREAYRRVIGVLPGVLEPPPPLPNLPVSPDAAVQVALSDNPNLSSSAANVRAAARDVRVARADRLPTLSASAGAGYVNYLGTAGLATGVAALGDDFTDSHVGITARVPLYQGGGVAARVRQAQAYQSQALEQTIEAERFVIADTRGAYASWQAARETIRSGEAAVAANALALEGAKAENSAGARTVLDVLNAEQELLNSQVTLVTARRNEYVAGFALLNAMGHAEMRDLGLEGGALYDPVANYDRVGHRAGDFGFDSTPVPQATRTNETVESPVVNPVLSSSDPIR